VRARRQPPTVRREQIGEVAMRAMKTDRTRIATTKAIAKAAGISEGALPTHVATRGDVLALMLAKIRASLLESARDADTRVNAVDQLEAIFRAYIRLVEGNPGAPRLLRSDEIHRPPLRLQMRIDYEGFLEWIQQLIAEGIRAQCIRNDLDPRLLALVLAGLLEALTTRWLLSDCAFSLEKTAEAAWHSFRVLVAAGAGDAGGPEGRRPQVVK
jgi:TetR/AcrR family fatty acid metabolism transcriptional regulator